MDHPPNIYPVLSFFKDDVEKIIWVPKSLPCVEEREIGIENDTVGNDDEIGRDARILKHGVSESPWLAMRNLDKRKVWQYDAHWYRADCSAIVVAPERREVRSFDRVPRCVLFHTCTEINGVPREVSLILLKRN